MKHTESLYTILRGMIREEIDKTPGFQELAGSSTLPCAVDAERAILGAVLLDNAVITELTADDYCLDSHQRIMLCMCELRDAGKSVDLVTLVHALGEYGLKEIGGASYLASLTEGLPRRPVITEYVAIVQEKAKLRRIWSSCEDAIRKCKEQQDAAADIVAQLGVNLKGIRKGTK